MIHDLARIVRQPQPLSTELDGEVVILHEPTSAYLNFNGSASAVWRRLEQPMILADLAAGLERDFDAPSGLIRSDLDVLLLDLQRRGLVRIEAAGA